LSVKKKTGSDGDSEDHIEGHTHSDHRNRVGQPHHQEELAAQCRNQFRLTGSTFEETTTQDADTDGGMMAPAI